MLANGATFPKLKTVTFSEGYRGMIAETNLSKGDSVMKIPQHLLLTDLTAMNDSTLVNQMQSFLDDVIDEHGHMNITLYMLEHMLGFNSSKTGKNFFQPYFDILPQSLEAYSGIPSTWSQEDLTLLNETSVAYTEAVTWKVELLHDYDVFSSVGDYLVSISLTFLTTIVFRTFLDLPPLIPLNNTFGVT